MNGLLFKKTYKDEIRDFGSSGVYLEENQNSSAGSVTGDGSNVLSERKNNSDSTILTDRFKQNNSSDRFKQNSSPDLRSGSVITSDIDGSTFTSVVPADPCIAVSQNHILQMVNGTQGAYLRILDKSANELLPRIYMHQLLDAPDYFGYGDPVVLYDQFANRFFISEFASDSCNGCYPNSLVIGVSETADPAGGWNFYKFRSPNFLVDYPKFAAWPNALYATSNDFNTAGTAYLGSSIYAFDKLAMINGEATTSIQRFRLRSLQYTKFLSLAPVNISGNIPPQNNAGLFMYFHDDNRTGNELDADSLGFVSLSADFQNPSNTKFEYSQQLLVAPFKSSVCNGSRNCVASGAGAGYDEISDRIMHRIQYRNFGTHESIVLNHTVNANYPLGDPKAGIRWYELRRTNSDWSVYQQSTFSPDEDGRFMGAININSKGQIAIAYNHSGPGKYASIYFTGRNADDPLNQMIYSETLVKEGTEFGTQGSRWGDYSDLTLDPVNDSIFWFSGMYGGSNWTTRISAFKFQSIPKIDAQMVSIISPAKDLTQCETEISPKIIIQSNGSRLLNNARILTNVDGQTKTDFIWNGALMLSRKDTLQLPSFITDTGTHEMEIIIEVLNEDGDLENNTLKQNFTILGAQENSIREDFEGESFPPLQWSLYNYQPSTQAFRRSTDAGNRSLSSAVMKNFSNPVIGDIDVLAAPIIKTENIDSLIFSFDLAYKLYGQSASFADTLQIVISTDCGKTFQSVWERVAAELATVKGNTNSEYIAAAADWKRIRIDLKPFLGNASEVMAGFRSKGKFGQNIYIDNVAIDKIVLPESRILISKIIAPSSPVCTTNLQPVVEFSNRGKEPVTDFKVYYRLNNGSPDSLVINGNLLPGNNTIVTSFPQMTIPAGQISNLQIYTTEDTVNIPVVQPAIVQDELKEGFENNMFPPQHWSERIKNNPYNWERTTWSSASGNASALIGNFMSNSGGKKDQLVSPVIQLTGYDSVYLSFDLAYPANEDATDTLELKITQPCEENGVSVFKKWGKELATSRTPYTAFSNRDTTGFVPTASEWKNQLINITEAVKNKSLFQVLLENSADKGHNLYIDNVWVYTVILPRRLKENGYILFPNPTTGQVIIRHLQDPTDLKQVEVINSLGQVLLKYAYNGNAGRNLQLDLSKVPSGLYNIRMTYTGKVISERIIRTK